MTRSFRLPDLGEGVHEAEVLAVHVSSGQHVKEGDLILEVETDKAAVEIPSPFAGVVIKILVHPGETVKVGDVMIDFSNGDTIKTDLAEKLTSSPAGQDVRREEAVGPDSEAKKTPVPASPSTRRLARELGVDLHQVIPTGTAGRVTAEDVRSFSKPDKGIEDKPHGKISTPERVPPASDLPDFTQWGPVERIPFRSIRKATAKKMSIAWSMIPHVNSQDVVDVTKLEAFRQRHKEEVKAAGGRLTLTVFALKAVATALKTFPQFNASLDLSAKEIVIKQYFHIGVAVNTADGLIVPVIRDVDRKSIKELSVQLHVDVQKTKSRKISRESLQGGTFTITNAGAMGGGFFSPIINYPEVAILGMAQARMQPAVVVDSGNGQYKIVPRLQMPIVLCIDHRVLDGADAVNFLGMVVHALEDPDELMMTMT